MSIRTLAIMSGLLFALGCGSRQQQGSQSASSGTDSFMLSGPNGGPLVERAYIDVHDTASKCSGITGVLRVTADSIGPFPRRATFAALRKICPLALKNFYSGSGGWQPPALYFHTPGAMIAAVDTFFESSFDPIGEEHIPGLWVIQGDSVMLPGAHPFPSNLGALRREYPNGLVQAEFFDDGDGATAFVCDLPQSLFLLGWIDHLVPAEVGEWHFRDQVVADSATVFGMELRDGPPRTDPLCVGPSRR